MVEVSRTDSSIQQIYETFDLNRSHLYYQPKSDPCEETLRDKIEQLSLWYPKYEYRRITALLLRMGYTIGYTIDEISEPANRCQTGFLLDDAIH